MTAISRSRTQIRRLSRPLLAVAVCVATGSLASTALMAQGPSPQTLGQSLGISAEALAASETPDGYAFWIVPEGRFTGGTALVLHHGRVAYRWPLRGPLLSAPEGQPEDGPWWYPIRDLTGNGHGTVHIQDLTSRSTTQHVVLDLAPDGVSELFNQSLHFTEDLVWTDTDGDGVLEPRVSGGDLLSPGGNGDGARRPLSLD